MSSIWFIGTSGWSYKNWDKKFYPSDIKDEEKLAHYSQHFNAVEVNASFYRHLTTETYEKWNRLVPNDFAFVVKLHRYMTQMKKLKVDDKSREQLDQFFESIQPLGAKLKTILVQLPPSLKKDLVKLTHFLESLPQDYRYAFEFRDGSWFDKETKDLLQKHNIALVISDSPDWPSHVAATTDFSYIRFHGKEKLFVSQYKEEDLEKWAQKLNNLQKSVKTNYCFFNNTDQGYAIGNAKKIRELLTES